MEIKNISHLKQLSADQLFPLLLFLESSTEPEAGIYAVGETIYNRLLNPVFPDTFKEVMLQPYQFSAFNSDSEGQLNFDVIRNIEDFYLNSSLQERFNKFAKPFLSGNPTNFTNGADHYLNEDLTKKWNNGTLPEWFYSLENKITIGNHTFGKSPDFFFSTDKAIKTIVSTFDNFTTTVEENPGKSFGAFGTVVGIAIIIFLLKS